MKYALVSDIHANLYAWNAVLRDIRSAGIDQIISLGDVIGYGTHPAETLQSMHSHVDYFVLGNHDAVICGKISGDLFNEYAGKSIEWTSLRINSRARRFISSFPLSIKGMGFRCAHGDFHDPAGFNYIIEAGDAMQSWQSVDENLLFAGHTHEPAIFILGSSGIPRHVEPQDFSLEAGKRYIVNTGSVGCPRDNDPRASYCIYDEDAGAVFWRRVPFDVDACRVSLAASGFDPSYFNFINLDTRGKTAPLRETLDFSPPSEDSGKARDSIKVAELDELRKQAGRWRMFCLAAIILLAAIIISGGYAVFRTKTRAGLSRGDTIPVQDASRAAPEANLIALDPVPGDPSGIPAGWTVYRGNKSKQSVLFPEQGLMIVSSGSRDTFSMQFSEISVEAGMRISVGALFRKDPSFRGSVALTIALKRSTGQGSHEIFGDFLIKEPAITRQNGWKQAKQTVVMPASAVAIIPGIRGSFTGSVEIQQITVCRK